MFFFVGREREKHENAGKGEKVAGMKRRRETGDGKPETGNGKRVERVAGLQGRKVGNWMSVNGCD